MARIEGTAASETLTGTAENDLIFGFGGDDSAVGGAGSDGIEGDEGDDTLVGGEGADTLEGGLGGDELNGGGGGDFAECVFSDTAVHIDLNVVDQNDGDRLIAIEHVRGGDQDDVLIGNAADNWLDGYIGADSLVGNDGDDVLGVFPAGGGVVATMNGGGGSDTLRGFPSAANVSLLTQGTVDPNGLFFTGIENLSGGAELTGDDGANRLGGGSGDDMLIGRGGADRLYGDGGIDLNRNGFIVWSSTYKRTEGDDALYGGDGGDQMIGGRGDDALLGEAGKDTLKGGDDLDTLTGGLGKDKLEGDKHADRFVFASAAESGARDKARDVIVDFTRSDGDKVDLTALGITDFDAQAQIAPEGTGAVLKLDLDGDGRFDDFGLTFKGTVPVQADFLL